MEPGTDTITLESILKIVETYSKEDLDNLSNAIEDNPNAMKDLFGLETTAPAVTELVVGILKFQSEKYVKLIDTFS